MFSDGIVIIDLRELIVFVFGLTAAQLNWLIRKTGNLDAKLLSESLVVGTSAQTTLANFIGLATRNSLVMRAYFGDLQIWRLFRIVGVVALLICWFFLAYLVMTGIREVSEGWFVIVAFAFLVASIATLIAIQMRESIRDL